MIGGTFEELQLVDRALCLLAQRYEITDDEVPWEVTALRTQVTDALLRGPEGSISATRWTSSESEPDSLPRLLLTYEEVAERMHVSLATIKRLVRSGRLPVVHVGRASRISPADLDTFIREATA